MCRGKPNNEINYSFFQLVGYKPVRDRKTEQECVN